MQPPASVRIGLHQFIRSLAYIRRNPLLCVGMVIVLASLSLMIVGPYVTPYNPEVPTNKVLSPPPHFASVPGLLWATITGGRHESVHWFGTDAAGLDVFSRTVASARVDVTIALIATVASMVVGSLLGLFAGHYRSWFSDLITRASDILQAFPVFILAMIMVAASGRNEFSIVATLSLLYMPIFLRLTRAEVVRERSRTYVEGARALGRREISIALRHVLPNSLAPSLVQASVTMGWAILLTAGLSFIGAGIRPPTAEWGGMIATGAEQIVIGQWWLSLFPGIALSISIFGFSAVAYVLQERYDEHGA